MLCVH